MQRAIRACLMRGGSSKALFLHAKDLPPVGALRDKVVLRLFGSPDARQIDGVGGADVLTSKLAIVAPSSVPNADVDYTFGQVSFKDPFIDYNANCGNISAAVGPFAIDEGLVRLDGSKEQLVRIHNTNTGAILQATVPVETGAVVEGDASVAGVPGTGAPVVLDFSETEGSLTGKLLPTGLRKEMLTVPGRFPDEPEQIEVTLLDAGQAVVFVSASSLGVEDGCDGLSEMWVLKHRPELMDKVERIRGAATVKMGLVGAWEDAVKTTPYAPFVIVVSGAEAGTPSDLTATCVFMQRVHKAFPVTGAVALLAASLLPGTVPHEMAKMEKPGVLRIAHPSGVMEVLGDVKDDGQPKLLRASMVRTARRIMDGQAYVPWSVWPR